MNIILKRAGTTADGLAGTNSNNVMMMDAENLLAAWVKFKDTNTVVSDNLQLGAETKAKDDVIPLKPGSGLTVGSSSSGSSGSITDSSKKPGGGIS